MGGNYENDVWKQLQEMIARCDNLDKKLDDTKKDCKKEISEVKAEAAVERKRLKTEIKDLKGTVSKLEKENSELKRENVELKNENSKLRSQLNNDSHNSSLPPSTDKDGKGINRANTYNSRKKSNKSAGAQDGHKRNSLTKADAERLIKSGKVRHEVNHIGERNDKFEVRYEMDYLIEPIIKEYRIYADKDGKVHIPPIFKNEVIYGSRIRAMAVQLYSEGVVSNDRICEFLRAIGGNIYPLSTGSIYNFIESFSKNLGKELEEIKEKLLGSDVLYTDATTVTNNGKQTYIRNQSSEEAVLYTAMPKKTIETLRKHTILKEYKNTLVHDHETSIYHFGNRHGECNVHLLRYLRKNSEESGNKWSGEMQELLTKTNKAKKKHVLNGTWFTVEEIESYEKEYDAIIKRGERQNQKTNSKYAKAEEAALLSRLKKYKENHLLFLHDNRVAFDNNMSERDLRKCKNRQKMSGGFRTFKGQEMYCRILSVIETAKRKGDCIFEMIYSIISERLALA